MEEELKFQIIKYKFYMAYYGLYRNRSNILKQMNKNISYFYLEYKYENDLFPEQSYQNKYHLFEALSFFI